MKPLSNILHVGSISFSDNVLPCAIKLSAPLEWKNIIEGVIEKMNIRCKYLDSKNASKILEDFITSSEYLKYNIRHYFAEDNLIFIGDYSEINKDDDLVFENKSKTIEIKELKKNKLYIINGASGESYYILAESIAEADKIIRSNTNISIKSITLLASLLNKEYFIQGVSIE